MLDFGNRYLRRRRHHGIKIARGLAIYEIAHAVALPGFHEGEVGFQTTLHQIRAAIEFTRLFAFGNNRPNPCGREECGNARAARANPLGESSLRHQVELDRALQHHFFQQLIFTDVSANMMHDLSRSQQQSVAKAIDSDVVADGGEIFRTLPDQSANQIFRNAAQPEAADHDDRAVEHVTNGFIGIGNDFIHRASDSKSKSTTETRRRTIDVIAIWRRIPANTVECFSWRFFYSSSP